jgi:hypothetical protein
MEALKASLAAGGGRAAEPAAPKASGPGAPAEAKAERKPPRRAGAAQERSKASSRK